MEEKRLPFGKKVKCGNFLVLKHVKTLNKREVSLLRDTTGIPRDERKHLQRNGLPFIKVEAISGIWSVDYCCNTQMYHVIDTQLPLAIEAGHEGRDAGTTEADLSHLFSLMMTDTMVLGDGDYLKDKATALQRLLDRQKPAEGDDKEVIEEMEREDEAKAVIVEMGKFVSSDKEK